MMFNRINLIDFCKNMPSMNAISASCFKQVGTGATKDWEHCGMLFGTFHM